MIPHTEMTEPSNSAFADSRRLLLFDDDPVFRSLVAAVCDKHQWRLTVAETGWEALLPPEPERPKFVLLGFSLGDENSLEFLYDLHAMCPHAPVGLITGDAPDDVADVIGLAGGTAVVVKPGVTAEVAALM